MQCMSIDVHTLSWGYREEYCMNLQVSYDTACFMGWCVQTSGIKLKRAQTMMDGLKRAQTCTCIVKLKWAQTRMDGWDRAWRWAHLSSNDDAWVILSSNEHERIRACVWVGSSSNERRCVWVGSSTIEQRWAWSSSNDNGWAELNSNEHEHVWVGRIIYSIY